MTKKKIIVLGAGLAGLSTAWHLQKKGISCSVFEKETEVGGLCRSKAIAGFTFDFDGHLLHFRHRYAYQFIRNLLGENLAGHKRNAWIYAYDKYIRYPFQANLYGLPPEVAKECLLGFIQAAKQNHKQPKENTHFLAWINKIFGKGIARHFMIPYNKKFWTLPLDKITCAWLDGFVPVPSLAQVVTGTIEDNQELLGYNAHFWYPKKGGINQVALALERQVKNVYCNCGVEEIDLKKKQLKTSSGKEDFDTLVFTLPLPELSHLLKDIPQDVHLWLKRLKWNSILNLNLGVKKKDPIPRHWVYFPQETLSFFRVGFPHNFSASVTPKDKASFYVEVAYSPDNPLNKNLMVSRIKEDLNKIGLLDGQDSICVSDTNDIRYGYPIYDYNYQTAREEVFKFLNKYDVFPSGRYGSWRYMSMEDVVLDGKAISDRLSR
jgi:protoporphyrinogen oxidase